MPTLPYFSCVDLLFITPLCMFPHLKDGDNGICPLELFKGFNESV